MVFLFLLSCQWYLPIWGGFPTSKRANRSMLFTIPISNEWTLISTVVRLLGGRRVAPSAWMSSATTLTLGPVQCQNKTLNLFLNIRRRHTIKIYLLVIDSTKLWDGLWTNYCRLIFHRCTKHGAVTWSQWVARKKCLEIGIILLEKIEKQPHISYIYIFFWGPFLGDCSHRESRCWGIACPRCQHRWCLPKPSEDSVAPE